MKSIFFSLFITQLALAAPQKITVMGVELLADDIGYFVDTNIISNFTVTEPVTFALPRGNSIIARDYVTLYKNGTISLISSPETQNIVWNATDGQQVKLNCSFRPANFTNPKSSRLIKFYDNGEYQSGCEAYDGANFVDADGNQIRVFGELDVSPEFKLLYASKVGEAWIQAGNNKVHLMAGTEIAFHSSGKPRFFTPIHGETFSLTHPIYGNLLFGQKEGKHASSSLFANGMVERGILLQDLVHKKAGIKIPAGAGVVFSADGLEITDIIFTIPALIEAKGYSILAKSFTVQNNFYTLFVAQEFNFTNPQNGQIIYVPAGSEVALSTDLEIIGIRVPRNDSLFSLSEMLRLR